MKRTLPLFPLYIVALLLLLVSCETDNMAPTLGPLISHFTPDKGKAGDTVIIMGYNFSSQPSANALTLNGTPVTIASAAMSTLRVTIPAGASSGPFSITVGGRSAQSADTFKMLPSGPAPVITSFSPAFGLPGDVVTITGTGFSTTVTGNTVVFSNNVTATVTAATATQLMVTEPSGAVTGALSVLANGQAGRSGSAFEVLIDIPRNGLVAYYPFNGNANDESGNGFNLTLNGTCVSVPDRFNLPGKAYAFGNNTGTGQHYAGSTNPAAVAVTEPITLGFWAKYDFNAHSVIWIGKGKSTTGYLFSAANNRINMNMGSSVYQSPLLTLTGVQWVFFLCTYDGSAIKFYANGALWATMPATETISALTGHFFIQGVVTVPVDDVTIYNRVLGDAEIVQLYNATVSKK